MSRISTSFSEEDLKKRDDFRKKAAKIIGERFRQLRLLHNMNLADVGNFVSYDASSVSNWEQGTAMMPTHIMMFFANYFRVQLDFFDIMRNVDESFALKTNNGQSLFSETDENKGLLQDLKKEVETLKKRQDQQEEAIQKILTGLAIFGGNNK